MVMGLVGTLIGSGLMAYFHDEESATGNTFTAGTIDIAIWGESQGMENPWYSGPMEYNMQDVMPSLPCFFFEGGWECEEPPYLEFAIGNEGTNAADVWKRVTVTSHDTGILAYPDSESGPVSSEPEYEAEGSAWTNVHANVEQEMCDLGLNGQWVSPGVYPVGCPVVPDEFTCTCLLGGMYNPTGLPPGIPTCEILSPVGACVDTEVWHWSDLCWEPIDDIETVTLYDMYTWVEGDLQTYPVPNLDPPPFIEDEMDCLSLCGMFDPGPPATCTMPSPSCQVFEDNGVFVDGDLGADSINGKWMYLGQLMPEEGMMVGQSYRLLFPFENEYQGDNFTFTIEIFAQQTTGNVSPPESEWLCPYYMHYMCLMQGPPP